MTKEVIVVLVILILVISGNILWTGYLNKSANTMLDVLDRISILDPKNSERDFLSNVKNLEEEWEKQEKLWALAIEHKELDAIHLELISIKTMKEGEELNKAIENARFLIEHIPEMDRMSLKNIL